VSTPEVYDLLCSIGELIDKLTIENIKCYDANQKILAERKTLEPVAQRIADWEWQARRAGEQRVKLRDEINRRPRNKAAELKLTLDSIFRQNVPFDFEVIVVDDGSTDNTTNVCRQYSLKYYKLENHRYRNPSVARNVGYRAARGEVIITQSDDIIHLTEDAIEFLTTDLKRGEFLLAQTHNWQYRDGKPYRFILDYCSPKRHVPYFFLGALWREDLYAVGGNDEEFVEPCYDDNWFSDCLMKGLGLRVRYTDKARCHHVSHVHSNDPHSHAGVPVSRALYQRKVREAVQTGIYISSGGPWPLTDEDPAAHIELTPKQGGCIAPDVIMPRRMCFYWTAEKMSWMRYLTLSTFRYHNPDWQMVLYRSTPRGGNKQWRSSPTQDCDTYAGPDYSSRVVKLDVSMIEWEPPVNDMAPVHACDLCQWEALDKNGGFYSDMDILYVRPMPCEITNEAQVVFCLSGGFMVIGLVGSSRGNRFIGDLSRSARHYYVPTAYQSTGAEALYRMAKVWPKWMNYDRPGELAVSHLRENFRDVSMQVLPDGTFYPWTYLQTRSIFEESHEVPAETVGIHWFGGDSLSQSWNHRLTESNASRYSPSTFIQYALDHDRAAG
jgi:hypothetical protein